MTLTDVDLRAGQLQHTWSLKLEQFLWVGSSQGVFSRQKLVPVMQEPGASTESLVRVLLLGDLSPASSVDLCWGLPGSALSPAASSHILQRKEKGDHLNLPEYNLLCLAGLSFPGGALRPMVL